MNRESLLSKVKALLAKTLDNGGTEQEAGAALEKAHAMIAAYEISEQELELTKQEKVLLRKTEKEDPHGIKKLLAFNIRKFTNTEAWISKDSGLVYCGLKADVDFAEWLTYSLQGFVQGELTVYLLSTPVRPGDRRFLINGFVLGCCARINQRLSALISNESPSPPGAAQSSGTALAIIQKAAIKAFMAENNLKPKAGRRSTRSGSSESYDAGHHAGARASFGRPIGPGGASLLSQ